jgi:chromosomal replication initiation ATPase DnaA
MDDKPGKTGTRPGNIIKDVTRVRIPTRSRQQTNNRNMWNRRETILPAGIDGQLIVEAGREKIINSVLYYFGYSLPELKVRNRKLDVLVPRHYIHYFLTLISEISFREIGEVTGMDHASVIRSRDVVEDWIQTDKHFRAQTYAIATLIINPSKS